MEISRKAFFTKVSLGVAAFGNLVVWVLYLWIGAELLGSTSFIELALFLFAFNLSIAVNLIGLFVAIIASWRSEPLEMMRKNVYVFCVLLLIVNWLIAYWL